MTPKGSGGLFFGSSPSYTAGDIYGESRGSDGSVTPIGGEFVAER